ncbi:hypothetical protein HPP92_009445 [Vanilla planifolia]|uniref:RecA-like N-terminal domain-containing protein n=1 Tax=Vanilla planifolia TaxID=51239 RepID=A0A835V6Z0_VANPL|nr:hypothetical protein HPP92_009445 [Vanilla planifolia]
MGDAHMALQVRAKLSMFGGFGGPTKVTSGSNVLKFYTLVLLNIKTIGLVKKVEEGWVVEIYGQEASRKTTLALHVIIESQKTGAFSKALKLNGYDFGGYTITVEEARPKADINKGGGRDGGWSGDGGGVRDGGWSAAEVVVEMVVRGGVAAGTPAKHLVKV